MNAIVDPHRLRVDLLFLDLTTCSRCQGAEWSLASALDEAREALAAAGRRSRSSRPPSSPRRSSAGIERCRGGRCSDEPEAEPTDVRAELAGCVAPLLQRLPAKYREALSSR